MPETVDKWKYEWQGEFDTGKLRWGVGAKLTKGASVDVTVGIKNSNVVGLSFGTVGNPATAVMMGAFAALTLPLGVSPSSYGRFTTILPGKLEILYSDKSEVQFFSNRKFILGTEWSNTGGSWSTCRGHKYETYYGDLYKFIYGKENKIEAGQDTEIKNIIKSKWDFAERATDYADHKKSLASKDNSLTAGEKVTVKAGTNLSMVGESGFELKTPLKGKVSATQDLLLKGGKTKVEGTKGLSLITNGGYVEVKPGNVKIGPKVDIGLPLPAVSFLEVMIKKFDSDLLKVKAQAQAARVQAKLAQTQLKAMTEWRSKL